MSSPSVAHPTHSATEEEETVWLDKLPPDVGTRIASFLEANGNYACVINLSKVSVSQQAAVKRVFSYTIDVGRIKVLNERPFLWQSELCALLCEEVRELHGVAFRDPSEILKACFKSPDLVKISIDDLQDKLSCSSCICLYATLYAKNLRSLTVQFKQVKKAISLLAGLSALDIRELEFGLLGETVRDCLHKYLTDDPSDYGLLAACFPRVHKLKLACYSCRVKSPRSFLWHAMEPLCELSEVTLTERVPEDSIERLKHINCVSLHGDSVLQLVDKLPTRVVEIKNNGTSTPYHGRYGPAKVPSLSSDQLEKFAMCTRLETLECCIKRGTERALLQGVRNLRHLLLSVSDEKTSIDAKVYEPEIGSLVNIVKAAPFLKTLRLRNMLVQRGELREILVVLGARLEHFEEGLMSPSWRCLNSFCYRATENKKELEEVIETVRIAAFHNPSLQVFSVYVQARWFKEKQVIQSVLLQLEKSLDVLQRRSPLLVMKDWNRLLHELQKYCAIRHEYLSDHDDDDHYYEEVADGHGGF